MDLETFLALEKARLRHEEEQIKAKVLQAQGLEADAQENETSSEPAKDTQSLVTSAATTENANVPTTTTNSTADVANSAQAMTKTTKEWVNQKELFADNLKKGSESDAGANAKRKNKDDMEQWVSDTFYSYFPGYNNEYQKRQNYLRDRQRENQENFIKHQLKNSSPAKRKHEKPAPSQSSRNVNLDTARSSNSHTSTDKTDLEIIVNNPNYVPPRHTSTARPGSTRHKLLQDLEHTELSYILGGDAVMERKRRSVESETSRKQDYQRELMQQIEEKRRNIELIKEKERRQEEVLTKRLQDQLKTIELEEQLEKEKLRVEKLRYESEQNRIMRAHLLAKLENDSRLLVNNDNQRPKQQPAHTDTAKSTEAADNNNNNKVYKYFSNSARHEYRRGQPLPAEIELSLDIPEIRHTERECFHLSEKVCPFCDAPLRSYESCCLRCQRKLALRINSKPANGNESSPASESPNQKADAEEDRCENEENCLQSFSLVCVKCERLYALCATCLAKNDVCRACHRKRSVCMNCRRTLCASCLEEIACGRDAERNHINEQDTKAKDKQQQHHKTDSGSERSFKVLELNFQAEPEANDTSFETPSPPKTINNNLQSIDRPPYSINIERNSIFHPDYQTSRHNSTLETLPKLLDKQLSFNLDNSPRQEVDDYNIERVRKETDKRLSRYMKNYGDLASFRRSKSEARNRSTQTTPDSLARRDVVLNEGNNLSMPLLREMPKMTRHEGKALWETGFNKRSKIDNLKRRWEIPAVQKFSISPSSPRILTQVGAIRKQLQADRLFAENEE